MPWIVRRRENTGTRRLVLGFDAGCVTCSELARRIREQVGDKLELRSLSNPQVREWRRRALGEDAPWAPTLIEVKGLTVRAWTGPGMAIHLSRALGPVASWRVMQILGEFGAAAASERWGEHPVGSLARAVSRRQFLKGAGGAVAGAAVLAGFGWIPLSTNGSSTAQAQTQGQPQGCEFKEPAYSYKEITGAERDTYVNNNFYYNPEFQVLWNTFYLNGFKPRPDKARVVAVTYTSGGYTYNAYDLRVPFERLGQQYPVLAVTANQSAHNTNMAVFQRVSETNEASRVDVYRGDRQRRKNGSFYWRVVYTRSWQGPFPYEGAPVAQEVTPASSELLAPEATASSEVSPVSAPEVAPSEVTASEAIAPSPDRNPCEDCGKFVEAISKYTCYGAAEVGCGLVCFEPDQFVDLSSCEPQCGAVIAGICAAGVPTDKGTVCSPFCNREMAISIVRASNQYKMLEADQQLANTNPAASFDFNNAVVKVSCNSALVQVISDYEKRAVYTNFIVNLRRKTLYTYQGAAFTIYKPKEAIKVDRLVNKEGTPFSSVIIWNEYVTTDDGKKMTHEQFKEEYSRLVEENWSKGASQQRAGQPEASPQLTVTEQQYSPEYEQCLLDAYQANADDQFKTQVACGVVEGGLIGLTILSGPAAPAVGAVSAGVFAGCLGGQLFAFPDPKTVCADYQ